MNALDNYKISKNDWNDWRWQQRNTIKDANDLYASFGNRWGQSIQDKIAKNIQDRKMQITPYYLALISSKTSKNGDITQNPLWRQVVPFWEDEIDGGYDEQTDNWELSNEMKTPICQHKYDNRVILRMSNTCNAYCQFCFEALRTLKTKTDKSTASRNLFQESFKYIKSKDGIEEVILSGGDPLTLSDVKLEGYLSQLRNWNDKLLIRIHSRALSFNPFRVTDQLIEMLEKYKVNSFGVHICHPDELSDDFIEAVKRIQKVVSIVFSNMPFLRGINDDEETLHKLFIELYRIGVKPYYLYHYMPYSPGASIYKASVAKGIQIMSKLKRRISNIALPEYVLPHDKGKFTVPLVEDTKDFPCFEQDEQGKRFYKFVNWQNQICYWNDEISQINTEHN
ncbi:KamA family radical SAM protein [Francisella sp. 19X1-34]|uniref:KamA family radical SAM protein n=1 Tax=Francisella sp. 19X1-34 TaxID=3087177 RepID=UPI002E2FC0FF|nr:KamA family radical SAM protein [Francisella sp. 19X1-34]MED7788167.1 KamA family radical SAM protein [Francisella sp. 19X1-34]